jgi:anti-anti-sigma factor
MKEELVVAIVLEQGEKTSCVRLKGPVDISSAEELKKILMNALKAGGEIQVMLGDSTYLDVTAIQLLWAAQREAARMGVRWIFGDALLEPVRSNLDDAGFNTSLFASSDVRTAGEIG